jgi:hypothetical protein
MSNVITGARGDLEGYGKIKICPACLDITDEQFVLTLPHILQVRMSPSVSECQGVYPNVSECLGVSPNDSDCVFECPRVSPSVSECLRVSKGVPECLIVSHSV